MISPLIDPIPLEQSLYSRTSLVPKVKNFFHQLVRIIYIYPVNIPLFVALSAWVET
jgi:hypothetical protein